MSISLQQQLQLLLPALLVPMALSFVVFKTDTAIKYKRGIFREDNIVVAAITIAWLIAYVWITGLPSIIPTEAIQWLPSLAAIFVIFWLLVRNKPIGEVLVYLFVPLSIVVLTWSVISYKPNLMFITEVVTLMVVSWVIAFRAIRKLPASPALTLGVTNGGMAIVSGLGGSLLIAQLAAALASVFTAFILLELHSKINHTHLKTGSTLMGGLMTLWLLLIGRVYAELPLIPIILLLSSLFIGFTTKWKGASGLSIILVIASVAWLLLNTDGSSYY